MITVVATLKVSFSMEGETEGIGYALQVVEERLRKVAEEIGDKVTITFATTEEK